MDDYGACVTLWMLANGLKKSSKEITVIYDSEDLFSETIENADISLVTNSIHLPWDLRVF